ncbi:Zn-ribbon domain-containing OB-fold protein [Rhodococcus sp. NPDC057529]|uniref:Zn-ribbon domain-containing OB-fold protein n=1 Tax=Rhodococcus sp. NPDC057529 TaxID=3346158 RepID=UPI0036721190
MVHPADTQSAATGAGDPVTPGVPLPTLTPETRPFFTEGLRGQLVITTCEDCGYLSHPPVPVCSRCLSYSVSPQPVSGSAQVEAFSINRYPWHPAFPPPYVVAIVSLREQQSVHLTTNIVGCDPEEVRVGMDVAVRFDVHQTAEGDRLALPVFTPVRDS